MGREACHVQGFPATREGSTLLFDSASPGSSHTLRYLWPSFEGPHFISLIRLCARGGFATIAPAVFFDVLKITSTSVAQEGLLVSGLIVVQIALDSAVGRDDRGFRVHAVVVVGDA